jgi:predicted alpha/beta hydrolase family esterase
MADHADRFTVLIVPGLRDAVDDHWQTVLQRDLRKAARPVASRAADGPRRI